VGQLRAWAAAAVTADEAERTADAQTRAAVAAAAVARREMAAAGAGAPAAVPSEELREAVRARLPPGARDLADDPLLW
jgi:hypothetical protein